MFPGTSADLGCAGARITQHFTVRPKPKLQENDARKLMLCTSDAPTLFYDTLMVNTCNL